MSLTTLMFLSELVLQDSVPEYCRSILCQALKVAFFQKMLFFFQISQSSEKHIPKKLSSAWNLNLLFTAISEKFKFQVQDSFLEYFYFGDLTFWKKTTFSLYSFEGSALTRNPNQKQITMRWKYLWSRIFNFN
jgi:hypothetical protein